MGHHFKKRVSITTISIGMMAWQRGRQRRGEILGCGWWSEKGMVGQVGMGERISCVDVFFSFFLFYCVYLYGRTIIKVSYLTVHFCFSRCMTYLACTCQKSSLLQILFSKPFVKIVLEKQPSLEKDFKIYIYTLFSSLLVCYKYFMLTNDHACAPIKHAYAQLLG